MATHITSFRMTYALPSHTTVPRRTLILTGWPVFAREELLAKRGISEGKQPENVAVVPLEYSVGSYPNPFNPSTTIRYSLAQDAQVQLLVFDLMGREVARLIDGEKSAGMYQVVWSGVDERGEALPGGIYIVQMTALPVNGKGSINRTVKVMMMK